MGFAMGLWVFLPWFAVCSGFTVDCSGGFAFAVVSAFFLFFILRYTKHCKIFSGLFS